MWLNLVDRITDSKCPHSHTSVWLVSWLLCCSTQCNTQWAPCMFQQAAVSFFSLCIWMRWCKWIRLYFGFWAGSGSLGRWDSHSSSSSPLLFLWITIIEVKGWNWKEEPRVCDLPYKKLNFLLTAGNVLLSPSTLSRWKAKTSVLSTGLLITPHWPPHKLLTSLSFWLLAESPVSPSNIRSDGGSPRETSLTRKTLASARKRMAFTSPWLNHGGALSL